MKAAGTTIATMLLLCWSVMLASGQARDMAPAGEAPALGAVGRVNNSVGGHCTGVLVAPDVAVTAAHCLFNKRTKRWLRPEAIHFLLGYDRGAYDFHAVATSYSYGEDYDPARPFQTIGSDWVLLRLNQAAPGSFAPMKIASSPPESPDGLVAAGFARARPYVLSLSAACSHSGTARRRSLIVTDCETPPGFSGGPLIDRRDGSLAGIQVAAGKRSGKARSLAIPAAAWAETLLARD